MIGETLSAYKIESELGSGGMGKVYLAELARKAAGLDEGQRVALKVIHTNLLEQDGFFKRFMREAAIGQQVTHDNVVRTYDCDATLHAGQQHNYLVMEYVEGQTLRDLLKELGRVPEELCRHIGHEVAAGLAAIHEAGVVHRDIKPENVLITEEHVVKIMDLGVARLQDEAIRLSQAGAFVGSLEYAAPEQFVGAGEEPDGRADLHALGLVLYELGTGQHPYRDEDAKKVLRNILDKEPRRAGEVNPQLSPFFEEVIHTLIAKDRDERFATAAELATVLGEGEQGEWWKERAKALRIQTQQPLRRIRVPRETALYGRDQDLARLQALFQEVEAGAGQVVLVEGEAGIGKTRLVDEFVGQLRADGRDINFLFGSYPPGGAATTSGAFSTAYREQLGSDDIEGALEKYLAATPLLVPAFAALLRGDATPTGAEALTQESLQTVFVNATRALAAERPTIVLIDDLHFAPQDGRALFASLALAAPRHRILLVATSRPGLDPEWVADLERAEHASRMNLARLGPKDLIRLLKDAFRSERLAEQLGVQVALKSDGNPFFAFEIIRGLREGQFITQQADGTWVSTQVINDIQIPSSVEDLIQARLRDLTEEERELLDVASCCGFDFDPELVAEVVGMKMIPALRAFGRIENRHRLVRSAGADLVFDHHQVQESLYEGLLERLRTRYHAAIAEALEEREGAADKKPADLDGSLCVELCDQFFKGAQGKQALRYLDAALTHMEDGYLHEQAVELIGRALGMSSLLAGGERAEALLRLDKRLHSLGRREAQQACLDEAVALAEAAGDQTLLLRARLAQARLSAAMARVGEAEARFRASIELAGAQEDKRRESTARAGLADLLQDLGRYEEALAEVARSLELAAEIGARREEAEATGVRGWTLFRQGRFEEATECMGPQVEIAKALGDRRLEAGAAKTLGVAAFDLGAYEEAEGHQRRAIELHRQVGNRPGEAAATNNLANVYGGSGRTREALELGMRALELCVELGTRRNEAIVRHNVGTRLWELGAQEEASEFQERALAIAREIEFPHFAAAVLQGLGSVAADRGDLEEAGERLGEALAVFKNLGSRDPHAAAAHTAYGSLLARTDRSDEARAHFLDALGMATESGAPGTRVLALVHLARLGERDAAEAVDALRVDAKKLEHGTRMEASFLIFQATGEHQHLEAAHFLLAQAIEHAPEKYKETMVENVPLHREIMQAWKEHSA